jgi:hypothetical protein
MLAASCIAGALLVPTGVVHAQQVIDLTLRAEGGFTRSTFSFASGPFVDGFSPAQTGSASSAGFAVTPGITDLLAFNPTATAQLTWNTTSMTPAGGNDILAGFLGGTSLSLTLPGGVGAGSLVLSNESSGFKFSGVADNARQVTPEDLIFLPGSIDYATVAMEGAFAGAGLRVDAAPQGPVVVDLLADPMFRATYNGAGSLATLSQLVVRIQPGRTRTLASVNAGLVDRDGDALVGLQPPQELHLDDFEPALVSLRFSGNATLTLNQNDYASVDAYAAAASFWSASGFTGVGIEEYAGWTAAPIPEPGSLLMMLAGLCGLIAVRRRFRIAAPAALLVVASAGHATEYRIVTLTPQGFAASAVWDVNNRGQVAGSFNDGTRERGFVWANGQYSFYEGLPGSVSSTAFALSDNGRVVGNDFFETAPGSGVLVSRGWIHDGTGYTPVSTPNFLSTSLRGVSPDGRWISGHNEGRSFLLDTLTGAELITSEPGEIGFTPQGINSLGVHVGSTLLLDFSVVSYTYRIDTQTRTNLVLETFPDARFRDINAAGAIAGWVNSAHPITGGLTTVGLLGTVESAAIFMVPGSSSTILQGINDAGWLSGSYFVDGTGEIGFVAIPVPEPSSYMLLLAGLAALVWLTKQRNQSNPAPV